MDELNAYYIKTYWSYDIFYDFYTDTYFVPEISANEDFIRWYEGY